MQRKEHPVHLYTVSGAMIALTVFLGYFVHRTGFPLLLGLYGLFFCLYVYVLSYRRWAPGAETWFLGLGIALRALLLFSLPNWSDDFYRFLWDGRLAAQGIHPFAYPPAGFMAQQLPASGITMELYQGLNSPEYYTVYPPVCQAVFWAAAKWYPESISGGVFVLKLFLLGCETGTLLLLRRIGASPWCEKTGAGAAYALNPLAILEISGNCHFEGAMLFFLLAGWYALSRRQVLAAALGWAFSVASKLVPLLFLPILWARLGWRRGLHLVAAFAGFSVLLFAPLLNAAILANMAGSLNLYFRQFEFNASLYYALKSLGAQLAPPAMDVARTLGPLLGLAVFAGVLGIAFYRRTGGKTESGESPADSADLTFLPARLVWASAFYLACATTVHPWYVLLPFGLSLLTPLRFPLVWTGAAVLSYSHYAGGGFREHYGWIGMEYGLVFGAALRDIWFYRRKSGSTASGAA